MPRYLHSRYHKKLFVTVARNILSIVFNNSFKLNFLNGIIHYADNKTYSVGHPVIGFQDIFQVH